MALSRVVGRYFEAWISHDTWDSHHPLDKERFYRFVKAVARYCRRKPLSPREIKECIERRWRGRRAATALSKMADHFVELYQTLLAYEKTRHFPDPLIERTDIVRYHLALSARSGHDEAHINLVMANVWGHDWQTKLDRARDVAR